MPGRICCIGCYFCKNLNSLYEREPYHDRKQVPDMALSVFMGTNKCFSITFIRELTFSVYSYTGMGVSRRVSMFR